MLKEPGDRDMERDKIRNEEIVKIAKQNIERGERWHRKINIREIVFGYNDGSVSTLALLSGVTSGALARDQILIAGFSAVVAGGISMALGNYISSKSEIEYHEGEIDSEEREIEEIPEIEREEVRQIYMKKAHFTEEELNLIVNRITGDKKTWLDTMMKEELGLFKERFENPIKLGLIMFFAFAAGGILPVIPFLILPAVQTSLLVSIIITYVSLFMIGVWKATFTKKNRLLSGAEMVFIGVLATLIPYLIGQLLSPVISHVTG
jgi:predicted membrane protein (TIGR00267 family)